ncbi:ABC transporter permease [Haloprofundus salilacus]|uniref:ABC transporter permease n=1 Tax=Haloprofundus salilacus TaxID=2876190 RepID=UPI001CCF037E|nr:ABC transporter permease [Haloprofundus salilacus]
MLLTVVTGVSLGLASQSAIQSESVDYWIVPEETGQSSLAVEVSGPQLGGVHGATTRLKADDRITYATPVQTHITQVAGEDGTREYILLIGVIPDGSGREVAGLSTAGLTPGDPYYANGRYNGTWTGDLVVSSGTAELLNGSTGSEFTVSEKGTSRTLTIANVSDGGVQSGAGTLPVGIVHLAELQAVSGSTGGDQAQQILVSTTDPSVKPKLSSLYPGTDVVTQTGFASRDISTSNLSLAIALAAFVTALVTGVLLVGTIMGLEILADRSTLALLGAIGYSDRSRALLILTETVIVTLIGGFVGVLLGAGGIAVVNYLSADLLGVESIALFDPLMFGYGLCVAVIIGLLAAPYPVWLSRRIEPVEGLEQ